MQREQNPLKGLSNQVFCYYEQNNNNQNKKKKHLNPRTIYYVPGYMRMKVKGFVDIDLQELSSTVNMILIFTVCYIGLPIELVQLLKTCIRLRPLKDKPIQLKQQKDCDIKIKTDNEKKLITFTVRKGIKYRVQSDVFWTPFDLLDLVLTISVQPIHTKDVVINFNLMDTDNQFVKQSYQRNAVFGSYDLAETRMQSYYSNYRNYYSNKKQRNNHFQKTLQIINQFNNQGESQTKKIQIIPFQYAHFSLPLYRYPSVVVVTVVIPLVMMGIINVAAFCQNESLSDRVATISSVLVAVTALITVIRGTIPPTYKIVFIQYCVYGEMLVSMLLIVHSFTVKDITGFKIQYSKDVLFIIAVIISAIISGVLIIMLFLHYFYWEPNYNLDQMPDETNNKFSSWFNLQADQYFHKILKNKLKTTQQVFGSLKLVNSE